MASSEVMFRDYFLRFNKLRKLAVSCPDVIFDMQWKHESESIQHNQWVPTVRLHALKVVHIADGKQLSFICSVADLLQESPHDADSRDV